MVALGGYTRLSGSGLSMVQWSAMGYAPPLSQDQWQQEFAKYQEYSQYQLENSWMTLAQFKPIYLVEYSHRMLGRVLGGVFILGFVWFLLRKALSPLQALGLFASGSLIGLQGLLGWQMVQSGLGDIPLVASPLLAAHLSLATVIYALLLWQGWRFSNPATIFRCDISPLLKKATVGFCLLLFLVIASGALVAGLEGTPPELLAGLDQLDGFFATFGDFALWHQDLGAVFLFHRMLAAVAMLWGLVISVGLMANNDMRISLGAVWLLLALTAQIGLGVGVVLEGGYWLWAWAHQLGGLLLLTVTLRVTLAANR